MDYRFSVSPVILANANRDVKKQKQPFHAGDFFPSLSVKETQPKTAKTPEELLKQAEIITHMFNVFNLAK